MARNSYWSVREIEEWMDDDHDEGEAATQIRNADHVDFVVMPPRRGDANSVDENVDIDDDVQVINDDAGKFLNEITGEIEVICQFNDENVNRVDSPECEYVESLNEAAAQCEEPFTVPTPKWSNAKRYGFSKQPVDLTLQKSKMIFDKCGNCRHYFSEVNFLSGLYL